MLNCIDIVFPYVVHCCSNLFVISVSYKCMFYDGTVYHVASDL